MWHPCKVPDEDLVCHHMFNDAVGASVTQLSPSLFHTLNNLTPTMRDKYAKKDKMLKKNIGLAVKRLEAGEQVKSALDYMIMREIDAARKANRQPMFDSPYVQDELYGYISAGHDTTSITFQWPLKHMVV
jgi:hypothetical protein